MKIIEFICGEYETLNFTIGQDTDDLALFHALYRTSVKGREDIAKIAMDITKDEGDISDTYTSRTAEIFNVFMNSLGFELTFTDSDNELRDVDMSNVASHEIDGKGYICSDFTAMMLERIRDIEKDVYKQNGSVMDRNELFDAVRERLSSGSYVMGTTDQDEIDKIMNMYY